MNNSQKMPQIAREVTETASELRENRVILHSAVSARAASDKYLDTQFRRGK